MMGGQVDFLRDCAISILRYSEINYISNRKKLKYNAKANANPQLRLFLA